jgi:hypothetical protein
LKAKISSTRRDVSGSKAVAFQEVGLDDFAFLDVRPRCARFKQFSAAAVRVAA